jgi:hypothetical protein
MLPHDISCQATIPGDESVEEVLVLREGFLLASARERGLDARDDESVE